LAQVADATPSWGLSTHAERASLLRRAAQVLQDNKSHYAGLISLEMGKLLREAEAEIDKCSMAFNYYADNAEAFLADEIVETDAGRSLVAYLPMGTILAVMPWNFPFWQVFRFATAALAAGNTVVLKHASNVPQCALAIEDVIRKAGFPDNVFRSLMIGAAQVQGVIEDPRIAGVTLTGSEAAGRKVASQAGAAMKKSVLELGGSDPFIVLDDCDLEWTISQAIASRFGNCGQVCIAAKRFILVDSIADAFVERFTAAVDGLKVGDPGFHPGRCRRPHRLCTAARRGGLLQALAAGQGATGHARLLRGVLRPGRHHHSCPRRDGGHTHRQRLTLWPGQLHLDP
jgi:succinate-semialdehyde dehydrogenase/glutarate-semialdehyde dehydrogenase